jgi:uncharacterized peroxidase-related enzyme
MARLTALDPATATGKNQDLFNAVQGKLGVVPNLMRTLGNSPALLEGYLNFSGALGTGKLGLRLSNLIALAVAESNHCEYCASAHTYLATNLAKIKDDVILAARSGSEIDPKTDAALQFARVVIAKRGRVSDEELALVKNAGYSEAEIAEIIGHVALNVLTNYFNNVAQTEVDFPKVALLEEVTA